MYRPPFFTTQYATGGPSASSDPPLLQAVRRLGAKLDPCKPCPCPSRQGWNDGAAEFTEAQLKLKGVGMPLRFRVGPGESDVAIAKASRGCLGIVFAIVVLTTVGVALS